MGQTNRSCMQIPLVTAMALFAVALLVWWMVDQAGAQPAGRERRILFLGNVSLPPMNFMKDGKPAGIVIDIAKALAKRIPHPVEIRLMNWAEAQRLVLEGRADALLQINPNSERLKIYDFSEPLLTSEFVIFTSAEHLGIASMSDLAGLKVGVEEKGLPIRLLQENPEVIVKIIPDCVQGFRMLSTGAVDAVVADRWVGSYVLAENNIRDVKVIGEPIGHSHSAIAVKKGNTNLLGEINSALADIQREGTYARIVESWRPKEVVFPTREQLRNLAWLIASLSAALIVALISVTALVVEITRRKSVETTLRESEERLRFALQGAGGGVWDLYLKSGKIWLSQEMHELWGAAPGTQMLLDNILAIVHEKDRERLRRIIENAIARGTDFLCEFLILHPIRGERWMVSWGRTVSDESGRALRLIGISMDITERKQIEENLLKSRDELEMRVKERTYDLEKRSAQLTRLSSELTLAEQHERDRIAEILHDDLQQLIVGAKIGQELLMLKINESQKPTVKRVLFLINQALRVSRSLSHELSPSVLRSGNFSASMEWLARWMLENQGFEVVLHIENEIPILQKDLVTFLYVSIRELLLNVLKHSGEKSAVVKVERQGGELTVMVSDEGVGFNPDAQSKKADSNHHFGLLSIRERLMYLGGRLEIKSEPKAGSIISMIVPVNKETANEKKGEALTEASSVHPSPGLPNADRIRVMMVDDHAIVREGLSEMLNLYADIEIVGEASDGQEAAHLAQDVMPDVILMDVNMPNTNGIEATRIIHSEFPHIRIIGLSMHEEDEQVAEMINAGASAYRSKNEDINLLLATIRGEVE